MRASLESWRQRNATKQKWNHAYAIATPENVLRNGSLPAWVHSLLHDDAGHGTSRPLPSGGVPGNCTRNTPASPYTASTGVAVPRIGICRPSNSQLLKTLTVPLSCMEVNKETIPACCHTIRSKSILQRRICFKSDLITCRERLYD